MKRNIIICLLLISGFVISCTEKVDIDLDSTYRRLIVYGEVTTDSMHHFVRLSRSADYFSSGKTEVVSGAVLEISEGDKKYPLRETTGESGLYETEEEFAGEMGKIYTLNVSNVDINSDGVKEVYTAETHMPYLDPLDSVKLSYNEIFNGWEVKVWARDPADTKDYYSFRVYKNNFLLTDTLTEFFVQSDDFFNGNYTNGITSQFLSNSDPQEKAVPGDLITFEINGITEDYYNFIIEAQTEAGTSYPLFSGPPANISGNISEGALGIFTAYSIDRKSAIVP